ncbi:MAG: hypothetical protein H6722_35685 [Sandaracinus sp.]|nr:hypothetical protein [Sandaracinus sp.]MCB9617808.1 hypothetical protein [Sandaracinus sp.]
MSERDLRGLDDEALVEALLQLTRHVRVALAEGDQHTVRRVFEQVREAAKAASHHQRDILDVAEGFLRVVSSFPFGTRERALARFVDEHAAVAIGVLEAALHGTLVHVDVRENVRTSVDELIESGALRPTTAGRLDVPPALRGIVSDLVDPLPLRLWRRVEAAREGARAKTTPDEQADLLARLLMVSRPQAAAHLRLHPIAPPPAQSFRAMRGQPSVRRASVVRPTFKAPTFKVRVDAELLEEVEPHAPEFAMPVLPNETALPKLPGGNAAPVEALAVSVRQ